MHVLIPLSTAITVAPGAAEPFPIWVVATWLTVLAFLVWATVAMVRELRRPYSEEELADLELDQKLDHELDQDNASDHDLHHKKIA